MTLIYIFAFLFGTIIGSFLNVCIVRLPQDESIVRPRSHCPQCGALIHAYDNIPILSYVLLRGRCRHCRTSIALLYPLVELLTGLLFLVCVWSFGLSLETLKYVTLGSGLMVLIFTDLKFRLLPNEITLYGTVVGLLFSLFVPLRDNALQTLLFLLSLSIHPIQAWIPWGDLPILNSLAGALFGAGILFLVGELYYWIRRTEGMGMGDVKMMGMVGAFLGIKLTFLTIMFGSLLGTAFGIVGILRRQENMQQELPFGTFLGCAALAMALYGGHILQIIFP